MRIVVRIAASGAAALIALAPARAEATEPKEKEQCIAAADQGQQARDAGKYQVASDAFARCARETCPTLVRQDCAQWSRDLDEKTPTLVFVAQDDQGHERTDVTVTVDGVVMATKLDGKAVPVDPGEHLVRLEAPGLRPLEQHITVRAGERNRPVVGVFAAEPPPKPAPASAVLPVGVPPPMHRGPPAATWVLGGLALAAFGGETYFGVTALNQRSTDLGPGGCAPRCAPAEADSIRTKFAIADALLGFGVVAGGLATYFFFANHGARSSRVGVVMAPGAVGLRAQF